MIGFATRPGTDVEPACSRSRARVPRAARMRCASRSNRSTHLGSYSTSTIGPSWRGRSLIVTAARSLARARTRPASCCTPRVARRSPRCGRAVAPGDLADRIVQLLALAAQAGHQDRARPVARADDDVVRSGRAVEEVPRLEAPLLVLDDQDAFAGEDEEVLLDVLGVVLPVRLAGLEHVDADPVVLEALWRLEVGPLAGNLAAHPACICEVRHERAGLGRGQPVLDVVDVRLLATHRETLVARSAVALGPRRLQLVVQVPGHLPIRSRDEEVDRADERDDRPSRAA